MKNAILLSVVLALAVGAAGPAKAGFVTIAYPGAVDTYGNSVSGQNVVGEYSTSTPNGTVAHAYLFNGSSYMTIDPPGATSADAIAVYGNEIAGNFTTASGFRAAFLFNSSTSTYAYVFPPNTGGFAFAYGVSGGSMVGGVTDASTQEHAFLFNGSTVAYVDPSGSISAYASAISGSAIVGTFQNAIQSNSHGFVSSGGAGVQFPDPSIPSLAAVNPSAVSGNNIVGTAIIDEDGGAYGQAFLWNGSGYTLLDPPGATGVPGDPDVNDIEATGVSGNNIVGNFYDLAMLGRESYLYDGSTFTAIEFPGAQTIANGVDGDTVVGSYANADGTFGFLWTPVPEPSSLLLLASSIVGMLFCPTVGRRIRFRTRGKIEAR